MDRADLSRLQRAERSAHLSRLKRRLAHRLPCLGDLGVYFVAPGPISNPALYFSFAASALHIMAQWPPALETVGSA